MVLFIVLGIGGFLATEVSFGQSADFVGYARIRDGGTLVVSGTPVRLKGLHCPELSEPAAHRPAA